MMFACAAMVLTASFWWNSVSPVSEEAIRKQVELPAFNP